MKVPILKGLYTAGKAIKTATTTTAKMAGRGIKATGKGAVKGTRFVGRTITKSAKATGNVVKQTAKTTARIGRNAKNIVREDFTNSKLGKKVASRYRGRAVNSATFKDVMSGVKEKQKFFTTGTVPPSHYKYSRDGITSFRKAWRRQAGKTARETLRKEINKQATNDIKIVAGVSGIAAGGTAITINRRKKK